MTHANTKRRGRPPKTDYRIGTQEGDARAALIASGLETLTEHGYLGAGLEGILKRAGVPKGSFYHYFASKEAFGQAVMERYASYFAGKLERHLEDASQPPLVRLRAFAEDAKAGMARHGYRRGCLVGQPRPGGGRAAQPLSRVADRDPGRLAAATCRVPGGGPPTR